MKAMRAQLSVELVAIASIMIGLLIALFIISDGLRISWNQQRQSMEAGRVANQVALAVNRALAGGNGTTIRFFNNAPADIINVSVRGRTVRAYYEAGRYSSAGMATVPVLVGSSIPLNQEIICRNYNDTVYIEAA
ncbi:MAG: hypothetical protein N3G22_04025 [Candidatus Micrarchaeota archaeon]|nr:hypothetical protein [Candidatus Micrarchaeota archaeon]